MTPAPTPLREGAAAHDNHARMLARLGLRLLPKATESERADHAAAADGCALCDRRHPCAVWLDLGGGNRAPSFCPIRGTLARLSA
ncbi:hypothetical protein SAMN04490244_12041 [Tranquillimonas rosea]|uniref:DUF6455 domain-containing protein n=1 Tax=Tranquillimonas rosea TaxID=641238 RepID=A0A1H9X8C7_9RHOB|nr:DUF6455 family protein [Tranquillimonas rosea]SES42446.1 hypothetical protein SAMN04490244_12041 [Tranquillimonas rosea]